MRAPTLSPSLLPAATAALSLLAGGCASQPQQFATPDQAVGTLVQALRANDQPELDKLLGQDANEVLSSGDEVEDRNGVAWFLRMYDEQHKLVADFDNEQTLVCGKSEWPMPIPLILDADSHQWFFDADAGINEILNRRIGRNEMWTINVCMAIVDAQRDFAMTRSDGMPTRDYAQKFVSDAGKHNGLFWPATAGGPESPLGELVAAATEEGYAIPGTDPAKARSGKPFAYHGYRYRMLKAQGPAASGGARDYVVNGRMIGGFAVVAYPAEYGNSGIMTFIVNQDGVVYQRDLGPDSAATARSMTAFNPDTTWTKVEKAE